jgi:predicted small secreted protein
MLPRRRTLVLAVLISAALVAGCGASKGTFGSPDQSTSSSQSNTGTSSAGATHGKANVGGSSSNGGGGGTGSGQANDAVRLCRQQLRNAPGLGPEVRKSLEKTCGDAARGDQGAVRRATREICVKLAEQNVPAGSMRDQTIAACNRAGQ